MIRSKLNLQTCLFHNQNKLDGILCERIYLTNVEKVQLKNVNITPHIIASMFTQHLYPLYKKPYGHIFFFFFNIFNSWLSLKWVITGFPTQLGEVGTDRTATEHAADPVVPAPEGSSMCCRRAETIHFCTCRFC